MVFELTSVEVINIINVEQLMVTDILFQFCCHSHFSSLS